MSLSKKERKASYVVKLREKINQQEQNPLFDKAVIQSTNINTAKFRDQMLKMVHYYYLLQCMGDESNDNKKNMEFYLKIARQKISSARESAVIPKQIAEVYLINQHTKAWNMAEYYYEKGSKILCQMMITLMDYIIHTRLNETSILYKNLNREKYLNLPDEIKVLNKDYEECYLFLCVYDYCTDKIADFTKIIEYKQLTKEHERIIENGLPRKVTDCINILQEIADANKKDYISDICKTFNPEPLFSEELFEECYQKAVQEYHNDINAMAMFAGLVIKTDEFYGKTIKKT
ncbi:MAG: hypothetical protein PUG48_00755 [Clostridia bacterium]|nr:hypothetical protein [Clostridia bacterium]